MAIYDDILGRLLGGRYRVRTLLGRGAFGMVFKATHEVLGKPTAPGLAFRDVALKIFVNTYVTRSNAADVFQEAITLERLAARARSLGDQPHIVAVHDVGVFEADGYLPYMTMELVDGGSLDVIAVGVPVARAVELLRQICRGVAVAHAAGILHRDLKPANVLFTSNGLLKVSDFGLAIDRREAFLKGDGGTVAYSAPSTRIATAATDVYALGIILLELVLHRNPLAEVLMRASKTGVHYGEPLRAAQEALATLQDPMTHRPLADGAIEIRRDQPLQQILRTCLALQPEHRYKDARELDEALDRWQQGTLPREHTPVPTFEEAFEEVRLLLRGTNRDATARALEQARRFVRDKRQEAALAFAWATFLEAGQAFKEAIEKQKEGMRALPDDPEDAANRLVELYVQAGMGGAAAAERQRIEAAKGRIKGAR